MAYTDQDQPSEDPNAGTSGTYRFNPSTIAPASLEDVISEEGPGTVVDAVYDETTDTYEPVDDTGYTSVDADAVYEFAAASGDDQDIHVGDVPVENVAHGALTASWMLEAIAQDATPFKSVEDISFEAPVRYDDEIRVLRLIDDEDDDFSEEHYRLEVRREDENGAVTTAPAVEAAVTPGEPYNDDIDRTDFTTYMNAMIGAFFDRDGDVLLGIDGLDVYTPFNEMAYSGKTHVLDRQLINETDHEHGTIRTYRNDWRPEDSGHIEAKMGTTVLETNTEDDLFNIL